jgi:signal transduction histidine kinase
LPLRSRLISLADFVAEIKASASLEAQAGKRSLVVSIVDPELAVNVDHDLLCSALGNLLKNAFKFSHENSTVLLNAYASGDRILIEVEDRCGGLPSGFGSDMFLPFRQAGNNKSGLGLGLSICKRSVEANSGRLSVRDMPGCGCVFTIDLPRFSSASTTANTR